MRALAKQLADAKPRWSGVMAAVLKQDAQALAALPALADEVRAARRTLLRSLAGMEEFLDRQPGVSLEAEWEEQFAALGNDLANRAWFDQVAPQTLRPEALIQPGDRDPADVVLRRTAALLADVKRLGGADLADAEQHLAALEKAAAAIGPAHGEARYVLYADACRLRRQIAFRNPLLDFRELLFAKHHRAIYPHMCDQYYGIAAMPGGGLYVLSDPFGPAPAVARRAGRQRGPQRPPARAEAQRRPEQAVAHRLRRHGQPERRRDGGRVLPLARPVLRRPEHRVRLCGMHGRPPPRSSHRPEPRPLGRGALLPRVPGERGRLRTWSS